ncbi:fucolectin-1-like [Hyperolius riggenbachi]|uniref:fucolectin-1-like n=1 Tax=Hyperolius riggenbachi TaxID=752182 RepID=UPI0035A32552
MKTLLILLVCGLITHTTEDEICNQPTYSQNLAQFAKACMSSTYDVVPSPGPDRGVDGITDTNHTLFPCSVTNLEYQSYFQVDLELSYVVGRVVIFNRRDCCWNWLEGAKILVGDEPGFNNPVCATIRNCSKSRPMMEFNCNGMQGRYVTIVHFNSSGIIAVCEMQVYQHNVMEQRQLL